MSDRDFTKLNPMLGIQADGKIVGSTRMIFFKEDGSPAAYADPKISVMQDHLMRMMTQFAELELRHVLILIDNLKTMLEDASLQGAQSIVTVIMTNPSIPLGEKEKLIDSINTYFTMVEPDEEITGENCQEELLKRFFTGDTKPN
jgi:hypothetical protein